MMGLPGRERSLMISLAIRIQYTNVTDGRTVYLSKAVKAIGCEKSVTVYLINQSTMNRYACFIEVELQQVKLIANESIVGRDKSYYAALLRRRGRILRCTLSVRLSVCLSVRLSVRPVIVYIRTSVTCFRQPCGRAVSFVLFTCQGRI